MVNHFPAIKDLIKYCCQTFAQTDNSQLKTL